MAKNAQVLVSAPSNGPKEGGRRRRPSIPRRKKRHNEICQILLRHGAVLPEDVRTALRLQETHGGQIGRILVAMNACSERAIARALLEQVQVPAATMRERPRARAPRAEEPGSRGARGRLPSRRDLGRPSSRRTPAILVLIGGVRGALRRRSSSSSGLAVAASTTASPRRSTLCCARSMLAASGIVLADRSL